MTTFFAALIALIHIYVFRLESLAWGQPHTNKLFRVSEGDARTMKKLAFNQGFYNLFLAIALLAGIALRVTGHVPEGTTLQDYAAVSVFGAGAVLLASDFSLKRPALIQMMPAAFYFAARVAGL
jgi:putative membrane protein